MVQWKKWMNTNNYVCFAFFHTWCIKKNYVLILFALWTFAQLSWLHLQMFDYLCGESYWHSNYRNLFLNGLQMYFRVKQTYPDPSLVNFMIYYSLNRGLDGYNGYGWYISVTIQTEWIVYILKFPTNPAPPWVDGTNLRAKLSKFVIVGMTRCHVLLYSRV